VPWITQRQTAADDFSTGKEGEENIGGGGEGVSTKGDGDLGVEEAACVGGRSNNRGKGGGDKQRKGNHRCRSRPTPTAQGEKKTRGRKDLAILRLPESNRTRKKEETLGRGAYLTMIHTAGGKGDVVVGKMAGTVPSRSE